MSEMTKKTFLIITGVGVLSWVLILSLYSFLH